MISASFKVAFLGAASALLCLHLAAASSPPQPVEEAAAGAEREEMPPRIEVCFVLDTTGSMGGLIEGAKLKIWSIANEIIAARPTPEVKVGLIGYRDRGDAYITRLTDLTEDLDAVYAELQSFQAAGGGDRPESVNQALHEAVTKISWSDDRSVLKLIFLVGDAPPHMDYDDDVKYPEVCELAIRSDIIINAVQCGEYEDTREVWKKIAHLAEGAYVAIPQSGNMRMIETPYDGDLARLNVSIGETLLAYGSREQQVAVGAKQTLSERAPAAAAADRLSYNIASRRAVQGGGDLIDAIERGEVKLEEIEADELPESMRDMTPAERIAHVEKVAAERAAIRAEIAGFLKKRQTFIEDEQERAKAEGRGDSFDREVARLIREQAARKGIRFEEPGTDVVEGP